MDKELKKWFNKDFEGNFKKPLSKFKKEHKKSLEYLDKRMNNNEDISDKLLEKLSNNGIIKIITKENVSNEPLKNHIEALKERRKELLIRVKKEHGKRKEVMLLHIETLLSQTCYAYSEIVIDELIDYFRKKKIFDLKLLVYKKLK